MRTKTTKNPARTTEHRSAPLSARGGFGAPTSSSTRDVPERAAQRADFGEKPETRSETHANATFEVAAQVFGAAPVAVNLSRLEMAERIETAARGPYDSLSRRELELRCALFEDVLFDQEHIESREALSRSASQSAAAQNPRPSRRHPKRKEAIKLMRQYYDSGQATSLLGAAVLAAIDLGRGAPSHETIARWERDNRKKS